MTEQQEPCSYAAKVGQLLHYSGQTKYGDESCLVALVVLANSTLIPNSHYRTIPKREQDHLIRFCQRLLLSQAKSDSPTTITHSYAHLVVLLVGRLLSLAENKASWNFSVEQLMTAILDFICKYPKQGGSEAVSLTTEVLEVLTTYCSSFRQLQGNDGVHDLIKKYFKPLWELYESGMSSQLKEQSLAETETETSTKPENRLVETTLLAIVKKSSGDKKGTLGEEKKDLHSAMEVFYRDTVLTAINEPIKERNTMLPSIIQWIKGCLSSLPSIKSQKEQSTKCFYSLKGFPKEVQLSWQESILLSARCLAAHHEFPKVLDELSSLIVRLVMLHVVSPSESQLSGALRLLAWTTLAAWVDRLQGFDWMLGRNVESNNSNRQALGVAANVCAIARLASGELRIQLQQRLAERSTPNVQESCHRQEQAGILNGCCQVLASLVAYLGEIADDMESPQTRNKRVLSPEALLHLHDSLKDGLQVASNYLFQMSSIPAVSIDADDSVVMQLLGALLCEFDVFDGMTNLNTDDIMTAMHFSMTDGKEPRTKEQMVRGLVQIFESARDDTYRVLLLKKHGLIGESMTLFLLSYWTDATKSKASIRSVPMACNLTELWFSIVNDHKSELRLPVETSAIEAALISWMSHTMRMYDSKDTIQSYIVHALNACVACFVTVHGDAPPSEQDGRVLLSALQLCGAES